MKLKTELPVANLLTIVVPLLCLLGATLIFAEPINADHTLPHCREMYDEQVPQQVVEDCQQTVLQNCADQYLPNNELGYTRCVEGQAPGSDGSNNDGEGGEDTGAGFTPINSNVDCNPGDEGCCVGQDGRGVQLGIGVECSDAADNVILAYLVGFINFLALGVGLVVTAMLIVGGIEYIIAGGVPQKLEKAKSLITNALIALVTFIFMYAILQWLIPGGLF